MSKVILFKSYYYIFIYYHFVKINIIKIFKKISLNHSIVIQYCKVTKKKKLKIYI